MTKELDMNWLALLNPFKRQRISDRLMDAAIAALPEAMRRVPLDVEIDPKAVAAQSLVMGAALVAEFEKNQLL